MMAFESIDPSNAEKVNRLKSMLGPQQMDQLIRNAIQVCWLSLPSEKQNIDGVEKEMRRLLDHAFRDLREDSDTFGKK